MIQTTYVLPLALHGAHHSRNYEAKSEQAMMALHFQHLQTEFQPSMAKAEDATAYTTGSATWFNEQSSKSLAFYSVPLRHCTRLLLCTTCPYYLLTMQHKGHHLDIDLCCRIRGRWNSP